MFIGQILVHVIESHTEFFLLPIKYCTPCSLTTHKIPNCTIRFWPTSCITSLRSYRTPLVPEILTLKNFRYPIACHNPLRNISVEPIRYHLTTNIALQIWENKGIVTISSQKKSKFSRRKLQSQNEEWKLFYV